MEGENEALKNANLELTNQLAMHEDDGDDLGGLGSPGGGLDFASNMQDKERMMQLEAENNELLIKLEAAEQAAASSAPPTEATDGAAVGKAVEEAKAALEAQVKTLEGELKALRGEIEAKSSEAQGKAGEAVAAREAAVAAAKEIERLKEQLTKAVQVASLLKSKVKDKDEQLVKQAQGSADGQAQAVALAESQSRVSELEQAVGEREQALQQAANKVADGETSLGQAKAREAALQQEATDLAKKLEAAASAAAAPPPPPAAPLTPGGEGSGQALAMQQLQNQIHEKDKQLENLKSTLDESTKLKDNEIKLVSTAFYEIGLELQQRWRAPPQPRSWLGQQRRRLQQERAPFGA